VFRVNPEIPDQDEMILVNTDNLQKTIAGSYRLVSNDHPTVRLEFFSIKGLLQMLEEWRAVAPKTTAPQLR